MPSYNSFQGRHKRQQFIDKKNAVTFHLVHRSQRDPLQADEESSKFVLQEAVNLNEEKVNFHFKHFFMFIKPNSILPISTVGTVRTGFRAWLSQVHSHWQFTGLLASTFE